MHVVRQSNIKGASLFVSSSVQAGTSIVTEEPFEAVLNNEFASKRSHWTLEQSPYLQRCGGCKFAWYVS